MNRRNIIKSLAFVPLATYPLLSKGEKNQPNPREEHASPDDYTKVKIRKVRAIITAPQHIELVVVKVETDQPG